VSISGPNPPFVGDTLTADLSGITNGLGAVSYQWKQGSSTGTNITGATGASYTTVAGDVGKTISVTVSYSGNSTSLSATTATVLASSYSIMLTSTAAITTPLASIAFTATSAGSAPPAAQTAFVKNTGTRPTGALTLELFGGAYDSFTIAPATIPDIAAGGNIPFQVAPKPGLLPGTHTTSVVVSGANSIQATIATVSFTVNAVALLGSPSITGSPFVGETLSADLSGITNGLGTVSYQWTRGTAETPITSATGSTYTTVAADGGQPIKVKVSYSGNTATPAASDARTVQAKTYTYTVSQTSTHTFPRQTEGYLSGSVSTLPVQVTNTGNQPIEALTVGFTGGDTDAFTVAPSTLYNILPGVTVSFVVSYKTGLVRGPGGIRRYFTNVVTSDGRTGRNFSVQVEVTP
jgi:hypothetical protein